MKKLMTVLTAAVLLFSTSAFAGGGDSNVSDKVKLAFEKDFKKVTTVTWTKKDDFYFAWFTMNDLIVNAAYNEAGELVCTSRDINATQLPLSVSLVLSQKYGQYVVPDVVTELNFEGETHYYVTVTNAKQTLKLKFRANGEETVEEKIKNKNK